MPCGLGHFLVALWSGYLPSGRRSSQQGLARVGRRHHGCPRLVKVSVSICRAPSIRYVPCSTPHLAPETTHINKFYAMIPYFLSLSRHRKVQRFSQGHHGPGIQIKVFFILTSSLLVCPPGVVFRVVAVLESQGLAVSQEYTN